MNRIVTFALAVMLAILNAYAQQSTGAYQSKPLVSAGANHGGYVLPRNAVVDGAAMNDARDYAFVVHWAQGDREGTALFAKTRLIARDGDVVGGKRLTRILPTSLSINAAGMVGFEATYGDGLTAIFADGKLKVTLSKSGAPNDFQLMENGQIMLMAAVAAPPEPDTLGKVTSITGPIRIPGPIGDSISHSPFPGLPGILRPKPPQQAAKSPVAQLRACTAPVEFPYPFTWNLGDSLDGPITSHIAEEPPKTRTYDSPVLGRLGTTYRLIEFTAECKPALIAVGDLSHPRVVEIRTPIGLLAYTKPNGFLEIGGFSGSVPPGQLTRADTPIRVNRHGALLIPVNLEPEGFAILLATPTGEMH